VDVGVAAGIYSYQFENVDYGKYLVFAGSDPDNNGIICDAGEACGAYIALDNPSELKVDTDRSGIDFGSDYKIDLPTGLSNLIPNDIGPLQRRLLKQIPK
jgi:serine protease